MDTVTTAQRILDIARDELGNAEAPDGSNKYGRAYGVDKVAWCAQFCWWVFREAGASGLIHPKTAYTPTLADWYRQRYRFDTNPRVGDLVFYNWPDSVNRIQHVGIVEAIEPAAIVAIEGNTSTTNQSDGGRVMRRRRARNTSIVGYGHPAYTAAAEENDLTPDESKMLKFLYDEWNKQHPSRVDFKLIGEAEPAQRVAANFVGMAINADARGYEARQMAGKALAAYTSLNAKLDQLITLVKAAGVDPAAVQNAITQALGGGLDITGTATPKRSA